MRFDLGTLDSGVQSLPFGLLFNINLDFYGKTNFQKACIDQILDTLVELTSRGMKMCGRPYFRVEDEAKRVSNSNHFNTPTCINYLLTVPWNTLICVLA